MTTLSSDLIGEMVSTYDRITEPEFAQIKDWVIREATRKLQELADAKTSGALATSQFYRWLLPAIAGAQRGTEVWAVSMLPDCEYDGSPEENTFLAENIEAARRGVSIRRGFVIPEAATAWRTNSGIVAHYKHRSETFRARLAHRDDLVRDDPGLLEVIGDGLIAFDNRVVQKDIVAPDGTIGGRVTMNAKEIAGLRDAFERLWSRGRDIEEVVGSGG
jgi:hypothetical protein